jgi:hypothetical protein
MTTPTIQAHMIRTPKQVVILRHGEKPADPTDPNLSPTGRIRAQMLARYLPSAYPGLSVLLATKESKDSNRPFETIEPLASALHLPIDQHFADDAHRELAATVLDGSLKYAGQIILICWHHEQIPALARELGAAAPPKWSSAVFDEMWQLDYSAGRAPALSMRKQPPVAGQ